MRIPVLAAPVLAAVVVLGGCYQTRYAYSGSKLLTTGPGVGADARLVGHFEAHERQLYLLFGLIPLGERANGAAMAARAVGDQDGAVNLRLSDGQDLIDMFVSHIICVAGLLCGSWSVWAEGDVVEVVGPPESVWMQPREPSFSDAAGDEADARGTPPPVGAYPVRREAP